MGVARPRLGATLAVHPEHQAHSSRSGVSRLGERTERVVVALAPRGLRPDSRFLPPRRRPRRRLRCPLHRTLRIRGFRRRSPGGGHTADAALHRSARSEEGRWGSRPADSGDRAIGNRAGERGRRAGRGRGVPARHPARYVGRPRDSVARCRRLPLGARRIAIGNAARRGRARCSSWGGNASPPTRTAARSSASPDPPACTRR